MEDNFNKHLGNKLKLRRLALGLTQTKVAKAINVTFQQIQKYEKGTNGVSSSRLIQLSNFLKVPITYFFEDYADYPGTSNQDTTQSSDLNFSFLEGKLFCEVFCTDWTSPEIANSRGGLLESFNTKTRILPCEKPIREFVISYDGSIQLCCHVFHNKEYDKKLSLIEPKKNIDIFKIYSGNILTKSRRSLFDYSEKKGLCASCNHYEDNIKESAEKFFNLKDKNARSLLLNKTK